jgi:hypothetical protein
MPFPVGGAACRALNKRPGSLDLTVHITEESSEGGVEQGRVAFPNANPSNAEHLLGNSYFRLSGVLSFFELATDQVTVHEAQRARPPSFDRDV